MSSNSFFFYSHLSACGSSIFSSVLRPFGVGLPLYCCCVGVRKNTSSMRESSRCLHKKVGVVFPVSRVGKSAFSLAALVLHSRTLVLLPLCCGRSACGAIFAPSRNQPTLR